MPAMIIFCIVFDLGKYDVVDRCVAVGLLSHHKPCICKRSSIKAYLKKRKEKERKQRSRSMKDIIKIFFLFNLRFNFRCHFFTFHHTFSVPFSDSSLLHQPNLAGCLHALT